MTTTLVVLLLLLLLLHLFQDKYSHEMGMESVG